VNPIWVPCYTDPLKHSYADTQAEVLVKGAFELRTPCQLFDKLEADFKRVQSDSLDSFAAYDFFVTAWHLVEWKHTPGTDTL
jgi:hypothetical protein